MEESLVNQSAPSKLHQWQPQKLISDFLNSIKISCNNKPSTRNGIRKCNSGSPFVVLFTDAPVFNLSWMNNFSTGKTSTSSSFRSSSTFSSGLRINGLDASSKGGPAFMGQVFSMCNPSGTGLMGIESPFHFPFIPRTPDWMKGMLGTFFKSERSGPVFRFFMDVGDAVNYVKLLKIPTGMVGACRLDVAYKHFKENQHMFEFVANEKQVKAANWLLRTKKKHKRKVAGVPVFTAQNLSIAIATAEGIRWYRPYFFDKGMLDNILEASVDERFHTLIQNRHIERRKDVIDDNFEEDVLDDNTDSIFEPPEVLEALYDMDPGVILNVISKAAEIQLHDVVDRVLLGNKWLRRATGIQPNFPYVVDSFEERTAASYAKLENSSSIPNSQSDSPESVPVTSQTDVNGSLESSTSTRTGSSRSHFPFGNLFPQEVEKHDTLIESASRQESATSFDSDPALTNPLLPKITMLGIATRESGRVNRSSVKKKMEELTRELEQHGSEKFNTVGIDNDPLFVANVGDYCKMRKAS